MFVLVSAVVFAQEAEQDEVQMAQAAENDTPDRADFWLGLGGVAAMYSQEGYAYGGSFSMGYGSGSSIGLMAALYFGSEGINTLELNLLLRFYLQKAVHERLTYGGPFIQILAGPSLYNFSGSFSIPSGSGMLNVGLCFGWRFIFADKIFLEPAVRAGYPYMLGAALTAGVRF